MFIVILGSTMSKYILLKLEGNDGGAQAVATGRSDELLIFSTFLQI